MHANLPLIRVHPFPGHFSHDGGLLSRVPWHTWLVLHLRLRGLYPYFQVRLSTLALQAFFLFSWSFTPASMAQLTGPSPFTPFQAIFLMILQAVFHPGFHGTAGWSLLMLLIAFIQHCSPPSSRLISLRGLYPCFQVRLGTQHGEFRDSVGVTS